MNFNEQLITDIREEDQPLTKLILFTIKEDINLYDFLDPSLISRLLTLLDQVKEYIPEDLEEGLFKTISLLESEKVEGKLVLAENKIDKTNHLVSHLLNKEIIDITYKGAECRMSLMHPLYLEDEYSVGWNIDDLRDHFSSRNVGDAGKMGDKTTCVKRLQMWFEDNPSVTFNQVVEAGRRYVKHCLSTDRFVRDCDNFIYDPKEDKSTLSIWVEQLEHIKPEKNEFI